MRKRIETTFSEITAWMNKKIHAVTPQGFLLKVQLFIFAFALVLAGGYFGFIKKSNSELTEFDLQLQDTSQITSFIVESNNVKVNVKKSNFIRSVRDWIVGEMKIVLDVQGLEEVEVYKY